MSPEHTGFGQARASHEEVNDSVHRSLAPWAGREGDDVEARLEAAEHSLLSRLLSQAREEV